MMVEKELQQFLPLSAAAGIDLFPDVALRAPAHLLVGVILVGGKGLKRAIPKQRFEESIVMRHRPEAHSHRNLGVEAHNVGLGKMRRRSEPEFLAFVQDRRLDLRVVAE